MVYDDDNMYTYTHYRDTTDGKYMYVVRLNTHDY